MTPADDLTWNQRKLIESTAAGKVEADANGVVWDVVNRYRARGMSKRRIANADLDWLKAEQLAELDRGRMRLLPAGEALREAIEEAAARRRHPAGKGIAS